MAAIGVSPDRISIRLSTSEKFFGLRGDIAVPREAVQRVTVVDDGIAAVRGMRAPGMAIPGRKVGTWRSRTGKYFVSVRRGEPAVRIELTGQPYDVLLIGAADAESIARRLAG